MELRGVGNLCDRTKDYARKTPMEKYVIENCKGCHQPLRIPSDIGGMLMRCPNCGHEFHTDFKLGLKYDQGQESARKTSSKKPLSTFKIVV